jgi:DNA modification methylase
MVVVMVSKVPPRRTSRTVAQCTIGYLSNSRTDLGELAAVPNQLYFGDNLGVLRESIKAESIDLIYLDPPFNSNASYNVLFSSPKGEQSGAQIHAFEDTWHWGEEAEREFAEILGQTNTQLAEVIRAFRQFLGENDMMAYLVMMANRLLELHRVLKPTGSLYLHCDPTASHYLKVVLDGVFGPENFSNEIIWKRSHSHNSAKRYGPIHDTILFYSNSTEPAWYGLNVPLEESYQDSHYNNVEDGRRYKRQDITGAGIRHGETGLPWRGINPTAKGRHWMRPPSDLEVLDAEGKIYWPPNKPGAWPYLKLFLDETKGQPIQDVWTDINPINPRALERLGYPTQKPIELLERIINASTRKDDVVLDPFCGCGTAVHAAEKLGRRWIGIDITHLAISLIEKRLRDAFPGIVYEVHGTPEDYEGARNLAERDKYEFQYWACSRVNAQPYGGKKKGADMGVDGLIFFQDDKEMSKKIVVSVKGGENVGVTMVKDLIATCQRQKAEIGLFVTLNPPTKPMVSEAAAAGFYTSPTGKKFPRIQILTIENLLEEKDAARYPSLDAGGLTFKKAQVEQGEDKQHGFAFDDPKHARRYGTVAVAPARPASRAGKGKRRR